MLFNSLDFAIFLPVVFALYWLLNGKRLRWQNILVVVASYLFYGWWDWRFLSLIAFSTAVDFIVGIQIARSDRRRTRLALLWVSVSVNLGFLGFFKYCNFFVENFAAAFTAFGADFSPGSLGIILPVGISFYTFQTLSYTIDIYRRKLEPTRDFITFAAFVSFFPQLVAGPIERATNLLPQFQRRRKFDYGQAVDGLRQILWGLFKKIVIADQCAPHVNAIFNNWQDYSGSTLLLGAVLFAFQIYCDFSGYSDIAIGTSRLFGFDLRRNFAYPYFSRDIAEFWRRWHISLSTWFRDYVYIPLGGSRCGGGRKVRNIFIVFLLSGFWHGASWNFVAWGALHALFFLPFLLTGRNRTHLGNVAEGRLLPSAQELFGMACTFGLVVLAWVFFRAEDLGSAVAYIGTIFSASLLSIPQILPKKTILLVIAFVLVEWVGRNDEHALQRLFVSYPTPVRWGAYYLLVVAIIMWGGQQQDFIYFQF